MTIRTTSKTVTFRRPFVLGGTSDVQPAGTYDVETEEELLDTVALPAYRRTATMIELHARSGAAAITEMVVVDPDELEAALARDAAAEAMASAHGDRAAIAAAESA